MHIVGITGPIDHGKTSFGTALEKAELNSVHYESFQVIARLAEAWLALRTELPRPDDIAGINGWLQELVPLLNKGFGVDCTFLQIKIQPDELTQQPEHYQKLFDFLAQPKIEYTAISEANKPYFRPLMQWMGGYFVSKVDFGIWYKQILSSIQKDEATGIQLAVVGGLRYPEDAAILKSAGAIIANVERPGYPKGDIADPTERQRQDIPTDVTILNNGSLADLDLCAAHFYEDLKHNELKSDYSAV